MKKQIITLAFLISTLVCFSNTEKNSFNDDKTVSIAFNNVKKGHSFIIKDEDGMEIYAEIVSKNGNLSKILDVSNLDKGSYFIELEKDFEIHIQKFQVTNNKVILLSDEEEVIFKPVIRNEDELLMVSKIQFSKLPIRIDIYFEKELIHSETVRDEVHLNSVYRLDKEVKGNYKVVVFSENRSYYKNFKI